MAKTKQESLLLFKEESVGPATAFAKGIKNHGEFAGTLICGDNYFNEHNKEALEFLEMIYHDVQPDLVIAGPPSMLDVMEWLVQALQNFSTKKVFQ